MAKTTKKRATKKAAHGKAAEPAKVLVLRTCDYLMRAHGGFQWPESGPVSCSDWKPTATCGNGLHGLLWGEGDGDLLSWDESAKWLVVEVAAADVVSIDDRKCKFPRGNVVFCGKGDDAVAYLQARSPAGKICVRGTATAGDGGTATAGVRGTATAGYGGTATAGDRGTATAGYGGTATAGDGGTATAGDGGTATAGYGGTATAGYRGTATAGDGGTATAGDGGTATAGVRGTATAGYGGTATAGVRGTATAGYGGTATAGDGGEIRIRWWDAKTERYRCAVGYVGDDGIETKVAYLVVDGRLTKKPA